MKRVPLYTNHPQAACADVEPLEVDSACTRCELRDGVRSVCMRPEGDPGGLYLIAEAPGTHEDASGSPFTGSSGRFLRQLVAKYWKNKPVVYDNALRCSLKGREVRERYANACQPYTASVLNEVRPQRIVCLGAWGAYSILGRKPLVLSTRRGYGWWIDEARLVNDGVGAYVPVYFTCNPAAALRNRFLARQFEQDLAWALTAPTPKPYTHDAFTIMVDSEDTAMEALDVLTRGEAHVVFDTETSGVMFDTDFRVEMVTFYTALGKVGYTWNRQAIEDEVLRSYLIAVLKKAQLVGHNTKYDALAVKLDALLNVSVERRIYSDTRLERKMLFGAVDGRLEVAAELVGMGGHKEEAQQAIKAIQHDLASLANEPDRKPLKSGRDRTPYVPKVLRRDAVPQWLLDKLRIGRAETMNYAYRFLDEDVCTRYNARDSFSTARLHTGTYPAMMSLPNLRRCWEKIMLPAQRALVRIEQRGILCDQSALATFEAYLSQKIAAVDARLKRYGDINYNSPDQLGELLFVKLRLPKVKLTATGNASTDKDVLEELEGRHPIIEDITEHRRLAKLNGTYAVGMRAHIRDDGALHPSYIMLGTDTGRPSANNPNLLNIPSPEKDGELGVQGVMARNCFRSRRGYRLLELDYSQIELRDAAYESGDPVMIEMFKQGVDFHDGTAAKIAKLMWGLSPEQFNALSKEERKAKRRVAKTCNFQLNYDREPEYKLAKTLKCSVEEAAKVVKAVLGEFKLLKRAMDNALLEAQRTGGVQVFFQGEPVNWRALHAIADQGEDAKARRRNAERAAWNTKIQGGAAHYTNASLWPIQCALDEEGLDAHEVLTVYDSTMLEVRVGQEREAAEIARQIMTSWKCGEVPLVVDAKWGERWGELEPFVF